MTNGYEFGEFLKANFSGMDPGSVEKRGTLPFPENRGGVFGMKWLSLGFIFAVFLLFGFGEMWLEDQNKGEAVSKNEARPATLSKPAWISVQARPWGLVTIPDAVIAKETPVVDLKIPSGKHAVQIYYPPKKLWARGEIDLGERQKVLCLTDFTVTHPKIVCR